MAEAPHDALLIAQEIHNSYEDLAPNFGARPPKDSNRPWATMPQEYRSLMVAVAEDLLERDIIQVGHSH